MRVAGVVELVRQMDQRCPSDLTDVPPLQQRNRTGYRDNGNRESVNSYSDSVVVGSTAEDTSSYSDEV
jgi:hypothetical protein